MSGWTTEEIGSYADFVDVTRIAFDENGEPHVAYEEDSDNAVYYSWRHDGAWTTPEVARPAPTVDSPQRCSWGFDVRGTKMVLVWLESLDWNYWPPSSTKLHYMESTVGSGSWSDTVVYDFNDVSIGTPGSTHEAFGCDVALDSNGVAYVLAILGDTWGDYPTDESTAFYFDSSSWSPTVLLSNVGQFANTNYYNQQCRSIRVDINDDVHCFWYHVQSYPASSGRIDHHGLAYSKNGGAPSWIAIEYPPNGYAQTGWNPASIAVDLDGTPYVTYVQRTGSSRASYLEKSPWGSPEVLMTGITSSGTFSSGLVIRDDDGIWVSINQNYDDLGFALVGGTWETRPIVSGQMCVADLAIQPDTNAPWIVFSDYGNKKVRVAYLAPMSFHWMLAWRG